MAASESWHKNLACPKCEREGVARMAHVDDPSNPYGFRTIVEECPKGFRVEADEDDPSIFRFFCARDDASADQ